MINKIGILLSIPVLFYTSACQWLKQDIEYPDRYLKEVFTSVEIQYDQVYGRAVTWNGGTLDLQLDLYQPTGDTAQQRPAIVWIHGGGFVGGDKRNSPMVTLAERFGKRGYLCVSINYRIRPQAQADADWSGTQKDALFDAKAAVRWLRSHASGYRIDVSRIAIGGGSAGAFTSLNTAYFEEEGESGNPGFSSEVGAVVDFWGGILNAEQMQTGEAPLIIIHGTLDAVVPFSWASTLVARAEAVSIPYEFHPLEGKGHSAWELMDQYIEWIAPFLYNHLRLAP